MGRGRSKGKKNHDDLGSGEEEKIPAQKRRGRPQKTIKDEIEEDEAPKLEDEDSDDTTGVDKNVKSKNGMQNGKKRKKNVQAKDKADSVKEETENGTRLNTEESNKSNGFRHSRSRRKSTPRRAAEAVVECN